MTQFEQNISNLRANLDAQKTEYEAERWNQLSTTELAQFREEQERVCRDGVTALQTRRDEAIKQKEQELRNALRQEIDYKFSEASKKLEEAQALFAKLE